MKDLGQKTSESGVEQIQPIFQENSIKAWWNS